MKLSPRQIQAVREKLNAIGFYVEAGQNAVAVSALESLAEAIGEADAKLKLAAVTRAPEADSGAWQEAK